MDVLGLSGNLTDTKLFPSARHHSTGQYLGSNIIHHGFFVRLLIMPPTLKKLEGHIAFGLSVCLSVCLCVC